MTTETLAPFDPLADAIAAASGSNGASVSVVTWGLTSGG